MISPGRLKTLNGVFAFSSANGLNVRVSIVSGLRLLRCGANFVPFFAGVEILENTLLVGFSSVERGPSTELGYFPFCPEGVAKSLAPRTRRGVTVGVFRASGSMKGVNLRIISKGLQQRRNTRTLAAEVTWFDCIFSSTNGRTAKRKKSNGILHRFESRLT